MTERSGKSLISIDLARAVAALGVFIFHLHIGSLLANYTRINWLHAVDAFGALYAVPLFFLISGYCIHLSNIKYLRSGSRLPVKEYYKRRLLRIYPPYLIALLFSLAVLNIVGHTLLIPKTNFLIHVFVLQGFSRNYFNGINLVLWTISIELAFYLLYPIFYYLRLKFSLNRALAVTFFVSCISIVYFSLNSDIELYQRYFVTNLWFAWCCGAFLADKKLLNQSDLKKPVYRVIYCVILLAFIFLEIINMPRLIIVQYQLRILVWVGPLLYLLNQEKWFSQQKSTFLNIIRYIGLSSYSLYLMHIPLIALKNFCVHEFLPAKIQPAGVFIGIFIIPFITWLCYKYIEKPFMVKKQKSLVNA